MESFKVRTGNVSWKGINTIENVIPIWKISRKQDLIKEPYWFCYSIFGELKEKEFSLLERIIDIINKESTEYEGTKNDVIFIVREKWVQECYTINNDIKIIDQDFLKNLEYEEIIETFAHKNRIHLWDVESYRE